MDLDPDVRAYYERGEEVDRLSGGFPSGPLELARTKELIIRYLPSGDLDILDVGGGPGVHSAWLAELGHRVHLIDPIPLHVDQALAAHPRITAVVGDARALKQSDGSVDAVLLLGPLYHLIERRDRLQALGEAHRVLRPGGFLFAAVISRFAALLDLLVRLDRLHEPKILDLVEEAVATGVFRGAGERDVFTTAYLHLPSELSEEVASVGYGGVEVLQIEGPGFLVSDFAERWEDPARRESMLAAARLVESQPEMLAAASHLMAVARKADHEYV